MPDNVGEREKNSDARTLTHTLGTQYRIRTGGIYIYISEFTTHTALMRDTHTSRSDGHPLSASATDPDRFLYVHTRRTVCRTLGASVYGVGKVRSCVASARTHTHRLTFQHGVCHACWCSLQRFHLATSRLAILLPCGLCKSIDFSVDDVTRCAAPPVLLVRVRTRVTRQRQEGEEIFSIFSGIK